MHFCSSRGMVFHVSILRDLFISFFGHREKRAVPWRLCASSHLANHRSVSMVLDLFFPKHCVHKDTARYVLSYSKPFELLSKINVDFLPKSENQAKCVSFLSLNIHKSVIFLPITSEIHFCVKVFCHKLHTFASEKNKNRKI